MNRTAADWLAARVAESAGIEVRSVDPRKPFAYYGIDSKTAVALASDLTALLDRRIDPKLLYDFPTIETLSQFLEDGVDIGAQAAFDASPSGARHVPTAIVGMACRFPGARNLSEFWTLLREGRDAISEIPASRFSVDYFFDPEPTAPGRMSTRYGGFLNDIAGFDAEFFNMNRKEAAEEDPQHRLLLELAVEALDNAGLPRESLAGRPIGTFVGISGSEYADFLRADSEAIGAYSATAGAMSIAANRISYFFDFRGPSLAIDTACSSSLVALHYATRSLREGECDVALVAGVNLLLGPDLFIALSKAGMLAPDGRCKAFAAQADGYVRGEGGAVLILKKLDHAQQDGDRIHAVVMGTAVNQDGRSNGLTAPNPYAQTRVLRAACRDAGVEPAEITFVEAHGTGTRLGDPIEADAIARAYGAHRASEAPCRIGSVKTNIGHLEAAAGIAGVVKTALSLSHREIPPSLHFSDPNPLIDFDALHLEVNTEPVRLAATPNIFAGVSSFGFGGTNAHAILSSAPEPHGIPPVPVPAGQTVLLPLSAHSEAALSQRLADVADMLESADRPPVQALSFTASVRATQYDYRHAVVGTSAGDLVRKLRAPRARAGRNPPRRNGGLVRPPGPVFVFSGQGTQWPRMGLDVAKHSPVFASALRRCDTAIARHVDWSLTEELARPASKTRLHRTDIAQPAIFAIQFALSELWRYWGIEPSGVVGHSVGEIAAAVVAGALELEDAALLAVERGRVMHEAHGHGAMLAVSRTEAEMRAGVPELSDRLSLAAVNAPRRVVLSGDRATLADLARRFESAGIAHQPLPVEYAFHSLQMAPAAARLEEALCNIAPQDGSLPIFSSLDGGIRRGAELVASYWARAMLETVRFARAIETAAREGHSLFLEIGPHPVLTAAIIETLESAGAVAIAFSSLRRESDGYSSLLKSLSELYCAGMSVRWDGLHPTGGEVVSLPSMPWQREQAWIKQDCPRRAEHTRRSADSSTVNRLLGRQFDLADRRQLIIWQSTLDTADLPFLEDHRLWDTPALPASAILEIALAAGAEQDPARGWAVENLTLNEFLFVDAPVELQVHLGFSPANDLARERGSVRVYGRRPKETSWRLHAEASLEQSARVPRAHEQESLASIQSRCLSQIAPAMFYDALAQRGLVYGAAFRLLRDIWFREGEAIVRIKSANPGALGTYAPPDVVDACIQCTAACRLVQDWDDAALLVPVGVARFELFGELPNSFLVHALERFGTNPGDEAVEYDLVLRGEAGEALGVIDGLRLRRASMKGGKAAAAHPQSDASAQLRYYRMVWRERRLPHLTIGVNGRWLIFADESGIGAALASRLSDACATAELVYHSSCRSSIDKTIFADVDRPDYFRSILPNILAGGPNSLPLRGIVHLWSLDAHPGGADVNAVRSDPLRLSVGSVLDLMQSLFFNAAAEMPPFWIVTRGAFSSEEGRKDATAPFQAPVWGLARVLALEHPDLNCTRIDLDPDLAEDASDQLLRGLFAGGTETQRMIRGGRWLVPRVVADAPPGQSGTRAHIGGALIHSDASYLITGGMGGLGLCVAQWLVECGAKHLVLMGRSAPTTAVAGALERLRERGTQIIAAQGDVSHAATVDALVARCKAELPPLRGVIHAAGVIDDAALMNLDDGKMSSVLAPKVDGSWNLHRSTADMALDFFVLFSSAASVLGSPGQGNYAAANAFLDALAEYRNCQGLPALCINWGPWAEIGGIDRLEEDSGTIPGVSLIARTKGIAALQGLLGERRAKAMVLPFDLSSLLHLYPVASGLGVFEEVFSEDIGAVRSIGTAGGVEIRPDLAHDYVPPRDMVETVISRIWKRALAVDRVGMLDSFFDLGGDSVFANQMIVEISKTYGVRLSSSKIHDAFTVEHVARMVWEALLNEVEQLDPEQVCDELAAASAGASVDETERPRVPDHSVRLMALSPEQLELLVRWARGKKAQRHVVQPRADAESGREGHPMGLAQARLFKRMQQERASDRNHFFLVRLTGDLEIGALRAAIAEIVRRHENLRTSFDLASGEPTARVRADFGIEFPLEDLSNFAPAAAVEEAVARGSRVAKAPYELETGPLIRCALYKISEQDHVFLMAAHLLIFDVWSMGVVLEELSALYDSFVQDQLSPLPELPLQFGDFAHWQRRWLRGHDAERQLAYWKKELSFLPAPLVLPGRQAGPLEEVPFREGMIDIRLAPRLWERVARFARARGVTSYMTLLAVFEILVARATGAHRFVLGMPIANRNQPNLERLIGYFTNVLPILADLRENQSLEAVVADVKRVTVGAYENQDLPFDRFRDVLAPGYRPEGSLFRVVFSLQNTPIPLFAMHGLTAKPLHLDYGVVAPFDVTILLIASDVLVDGRDGIGGMLHYNANLFSEEAMTRLWDRFCEMLDSGLRSPDRNIFEHPFC